MDILELRKRKVTLEAEIYNLIYAFQVQTDLKVRKIHLNINRLGEKRKKKEFVNVIIKSL